MEWEYEYWFATLPYISCKKKCALRKEFHSARELYYISEKQLKQVNWLRDKEIQSILNARKKDNLSQMYEAFLKKNMQLVLYFSEEYPDKLKTIAAPPYSLYIKGKLPPKDKRVVAIVGARECTPYGEEMALAFSQYLAQVGVAVVSGMARGIDGAAHRGALNGGGSTFAVLGCGADICYPREHLGLYTDIQKNGGILSEYPPGIPPLPEYFPARNRIISALADAVLVMEARTRSGSLITADMALEQGKEVYALPGPVTSALSQGCNALIKQGADILISPEELLLDMGILVNKIANNSPAISDKNEITLETPENMVYSCLDLCPKNLTQVTNEVKLDPGRVLEILTELQLRGWIKEVSRHFYVKTGECPVK